MCFAILQYAFYTMRFSSIVYTSFYILYNSICFLLETQRFVCVCMFYGGNGDLQLLFVPTVSREAPERPRQPVMTPTDPQSHTHIYTQPPLPPSPPAGRAPFCHAVYPGANAHLQHVDNYQLVSVDSASPFSLRPQRALLMPPDSLNTCAHP